MKRFLCLIFLLALLITVVGCNGTSINNNSGDEKTFKQEVTIVKMPSPPKCKTTDSISIVNEVIDVLGEIEKTTMTCGNRNGWLFMIKINIDGQELNYCITNDAFTDSDGKQYGINNYDTIEEKIMKIYDRIDTQEVDYS